MVHREVEVAYGRNNKRPAAALEPQPGGLKGGVVRRQPSTGRQVEGRVALLTSFRDPPGEQVLSGRVILGSVRLKQGQIHGP